MELIIISLILN